MNSVTLSQWQFAITSVYHFFFVPLTLGLSVLVAIMESIYVRTGSDVYKRMVRFWGKLFLINFAMGVVTGIVQEFQFGMNWAAYSRFVGDIFGAPLAIEALLAFFLESTFLGIWIFGWDKLSKGLHLTAIWLVAIGTNISALWILIANSFMQSPTGFTVVNGRAVMTDFSALVGNPYVWLQFPHTVLSGFTTAAFFVLGISAYHILRKKNDDVFKRSFRLTSVFGILAIFLVILVGHSQAQRMVQVQPMKIAAAEALWESQDPAPFSLITIADQANEKNLIDIRIPRILSVLAFNRLDGKVAGINEIQSQEVAKYGPGNYVPSIGVTYIAFRVMVGAGFLMFFLVLYGLIQVMRNKLHAKMGLLNFFPLAIALPYLANSFGWILTEMGRQPWVVVGYMKTADAVSPNLTPGMILTTIIGFTLLYGGLMGVDVFLLVKYAKVGPTKEAKHHHAADESFYE